MSAHKDSGRGKSNGISPTPDQEIRIAVILDEQRVPESLQWYASESPEPGTQAAEAMALAFWDPHQLSSLRIDLWTKDMAVDHMNAFVLQNLRGLADTLERATGNDETANEIRQLAQHLGHTLPLPTRDEDAEPDA
ncbi:MAG: gliding motility protein GldC [Acidobacteriota bacterium]